MQLPLPDGGVMLVMPASDAELAIVKIVTVCPANPARGLPQVTGEMLVRSSRDGRLLGIWDAAAITAARTAAVSMLAARLAGVDAETRLDVEPASGGTPVAPASRLRTPVLIVGSGVQATAHALACVTCLGAERLVIAARDRSRGESLASLLCRQTGLGTASVQVIDAAPRSLREALDDCRIVVTATSSLRPVLPDEVAPGTFIAAIGAYRPDMAEVPPAVVRRAAMRSARFPRGTLWVDTLEGARQEAGDLLQADIDWSQVHDLAGLTGENGAMAPLHRAADADITLFKGVGCSLWDLAAAHAALAGDPPRSAEVVRL
jgi:ornithine cyclodeaminase